MAGISTYQSVVYNRLMQRLTSLLKQYAPSVLRLGMVAVILWFSLQQFMHADVWTAYVPDSMTALTHLGATTLVYFNAVFELVFGILLVVGWQTRIVALLLSLHLFDIMWVVGYGEIGVRDFGLAIATLAVCMHGPDVLCAEQKENVAQIPPQQSMSQPVSQPHRLV